jgi:hypothetical protein
MRHRERSQWEKYRALGIRRFVIQQGVFGFGTTCALLMLVWGDLFDPPPPSNSHLITRTAITCMLMGLGWGMTVWWLMERRYRADVERKADQIIVGPPDRDK